MHGRCNKVGADHKKVLFYFIKGQYRENTYIHVEQHLSYLVLGTRLFNISICSSVKLSKLTREKRNVTGVTLIY